MNKPIYILTCICVGSLVTLGVQELLKQSKSSHIETKLQKKLSGWHTAKDRSTDDFLMIEGFRAPNLLEGKKITSFGKAFKSTEVALLIEPEDRNGISILLGKTQGQIHSIKLKDKTGALLWLIDDNLDGQFDDAMFEAKGICCNYARSSIFPSGIYSSTGNLARVAGGYHELDSIGHDPWVKIENMWYGLEWKPGQGYVVLKRGENPDEETAEKMPVD